MRDTAMLRQLLREGHCCTSALAAMGLHWRGEENPALLQSLQTLCNGLNSGLLCGALSGGAVLLGLLVSERAPELTSELTEWFIATYKHTDCRDILEYPLQRAAICPALIEDVCAKVKEIAGENGFIFPEENDD